MASEKIANLENMIYDHAQYVFAYLPIQDLKNLACVSKSLSLLVQNHWDRMSSKTAFEKQLKKFLETQMALSKEFQIIAEFQSCKKTLGSIFTNCLRLCFTKRQSLVHFENIAYVTEPLYYDKVYEEDLQRPVLHLKTICWLSLSHTFYDVAPGYYKVILRTKFQNNFVWPQSRHPAVATIKCSDSEGFHEKNTAIYFSQWYDIRNSIKNGVEYYSAQGFSANNFNIVNGWFDICFNNIRVLSYCSVTFLFKDTSNPWWKEGLLWDFVELKPSMTASNFHF